MMNAQTGSDGRAETGRRDKPGITHAIHSRGQPMPLISNAIRASDSLCPRASAHSQSDAQRLAH
jgi:hypothetical protein